MRCETLRTFVICLERKAKERCDVNMKSILDVFPLAVRTHAVDAGAIDVNDPRISYYARYYIQNDIESDFMHLGSMGAVGCALSHIGLWERCVRMNEPIVVVEDDMYFTASKQRRIKKAVSQIPKDCDFAGIMYIPVMTEYLRSSECAAKWCNVEQGYAGTQLYYLTPRGACILLQNALPVVVHIDQYIGYASAAVPEFQALYWNEQIYTLSDFISDNANNTIHHLPTIRKILPHGNTFYIIWILVVITLFSWATVSTVWLLKRSK